MKYYYLEMTGSSRKRQRYPIAEGANSIGRNPVDNHIVLPSGSVSGYHAIVYRTGTAVTIQDNNSKNGIYINEKKVQAMDLLPGDVIGFGMTGPKLQLVASDISLPLNRGTHAGTPSKTPLHQNDPGGKQDRVNSTASLPGINPVYTPLEETSPTDVPPSVTMEIEKQLGSKHVNPDIIARLIENDTRLEKIIKRGKIPSKLLSLLLGVYSAKKKSRKRWVLLVAVFSFVSLLVIGFMGVTMIRYQRVLQKGLSLENRLDYYETEISKINKLSDADKMRLVTLIKEFDKTKKELVQVKGNLHQKDYGRFYADDIERAIDNIMRLFGETDYHIPPQMTQRVKYHLRVYTTNLKPVINRYLVRKRIYFQMITQIFEEKKLPKQLGYIAMLESGYNPRALSHCGARGMWQFMPETARRYRLQVDRYSDERVVPERATAAAAEYLKDLIAIFGGKSSIMLVMAAYNAGEGRILRALQKIDDPLRNRDFWYMYRMGYLPEETNEYIPRVIALMMIDMNPGMFGFDSIQRGDSTAQNPESDFVDISAQNR